METNENSNACDSSENAANEAFLVQSFYRFFHLEEERLIEVKRALETKAEQLGVGGLLIIANEGINGTIAGTNNSSSLFINFLLDNSDSSIAALSHSDKLGAWNVKEARSEDFPFRRFKIKRREEIVTSGDETIDARSSSEHLSPEEWDRMISENPDLTLLDTRNWYETEIGKFRGAIDPKLNNFQEFTDFVLKSSPPKDKPVLMYCTGGIRCEKASLQMKSLGYEKVYQLKGGILKYFEKVGRGLYEGDCLVFDKRVAVDPNLKPTGEYVFCPHCGQPGKEKITCDNCQTEAKICHRCSEKPFKSTCSKNCANQLQFKAERAKENRAKENSARTKDSLMA
ncbi:hypothetical protein BVY02_00105 [bacterium J17]|nr:hypothetical protein BVY02_00105 [bacterium J17]